MKKVYYVIVLVVLILFILFGLIYFKYFYSLEDYDVTTKEGCEKSGGKWETIGLDLDEECNLKTSDFGNVCYDRSDCEGECIAELNNEEIKTIIEHSISKNGKCSEYRIVVGCRYFVNSGKVDGLVCVD